MGIVSVESFANQRHRVTVIQVKRVVYPFTKTFAIASSAKEPIINRRKATNKSLTNRLRPTKGKRTTVLAGVTPFSLSSLADSRKTSSHFLFSPTPTHS
jgi:hypothetical protein